MSKYPSRDLESVEAKFCQDWVPYSPRLGLQSLRNPFLQLDPLIGRGDCGTDCFWNKDPLESVSACKWRLRCALCIQGSKMDFTALLLIFGFVKHSFNYFVAVIHVWSEVYTCSTLSLVYWGKWFQENEGADGGEKKEEKVKELEGAVIFLWLPVLFLFSLINWHNYHQENSAKSFLFRMEKQEGNYGVSLWQGFVIASERGLYFTRFN